MAYLGRSLRREGVREQPALRAAVALALSLALNALAGWLLAVGGAFDAPKAPASARVALARIDTADWEANRAIRGERTPPEGSAERPAGPVVELPPDDGTPDEAPKDARHAAERDHKVERETVSRHAGNYPKYAPKPQIALPGPEGAGVHAEADAARERERGKRGGDAPAPKEGEERERGDRLALAPAPFGDRSRGEGGEGGRRARGKLTPDLSLGSGTAAKVLAGPNLDGYREGLDEAEETALNARSFKYATFFNRFREELAEEFVPRMRAAWRARDPDGSMFFYKDRTVVLDVALDPEGRVKDLSVLETSNVDFYDRVAMESLRAAQPYPNLPRGLLDDGGEARFVYTITLYAGDSRPRLRWSRRSW